MATSADFCYKQNNTYKAAYEELSNQTHKWHDLMRNGFLFSKKGDNKDGSINWSCKHKGCSATITASPQETILRETEHSVAHAVHTSDELLGRDFKAKVKIAVARGEGTSIQQVHHQLQAEFTAASTHANEALANILPSFEKMCSTLKYRKAHGRPELPKSIQGIDLAGSSLLQHKARSSWYTKRRWCDNWLLCEWILCVLIYVSEWMNIVCSYICEWMNEYCVMWSYVWAWNILKK